MTKTHLTLVTAASVLLLILPTGFLRAAPAAAQLLAAATISRPAHNLVAAASTDARIPLDPREVVSLNLTFSRSTDPVRFVAPNGGSINGQGGHVEISPAASGGSIPLTFTVGRSRGLYTLEMNQGNQTQIFEFWVGVESPTGRPGPNLHFKGTR